MYPNGKALRTRHKRTRYAMLLTRINKIADSFDCKISVAQMVWMIENLKKGTPRILI